MKTVEHMGIMRIVKATRVVQRKDGPKRQYKIRMWSGGWSWVNAESCNACREG